MSTGLHTTITIQLNGENIEQRSFDDTIESITIGSGPDADISIDLDGLAEMHALLFFHNGTVLAEEIGGQVLVNEAPLDKNVPGNNGDSLQIGPATLVMNIQALANEADEVTDPNVDVATNNTPSLDIDENTDDEELVEFGLDGLIESIQNSTATGAKTHLAIHQVFGTDIIAMKSFTSCDTDIQMGSEIGTKLRFAGNCTS